MSQNISSTVDCLPDEHEYLTYIKKVIRHRCRQSGFRRITPSFLLPLELCQTITDNARKTISSIGIIQNEKGQNFVIRFDPVISVAKAYKENNMDKWAQPVELYCIDAFFQKTQEKELMYQDYLGVHIIGTHDSALSAQVIYLANKILDDLGLREIYTVQINHIGSMESRKLFLEDLKNFYFDKHRSLCKICQVFKERKEYLELLRCQEEDCCILAQLGPKIQHYLSKDDKEQYENFKGYLTELNIDFKENKGLFGMKNYNANIVFEFWNNDKGQKDTSIYGGSNDFLLEKLGLAMNDMIGFSSNIWDIIKTMKSVGIRVPHKDHLQVFVAQLGTRAKRKAISLLEKLREAGIQAVGAMGTGSMRTQLDIAANFKVKYTLLMGEIEVNEKMVIIRDMQTGTQETVPYNHVLEIMQDRIGKEKIDIMEDKEISIDLKKIK